MSTAPITIYCDGGCRPNPGPGGWGAVVVLPDGVRELAGSAPRSTNNRMELTAALHGLEVTPPGSEVELLTDSTYLKDGITRWLPTWRRKGWVTAARQPVLNRDLWVALDEAASRRRVNWRWVRGHAGDPGNERAHELAAAAIPTAAGAGGADHAASTPGAGAAAAPRPATPPGEHVDAFVAVAWSGKRGEAAWGALLRFRELEKELGGRLRVPSANAAHIASAALALESVQKRVPVRMVTVSDYLRDGAVLWLRTWQERGWRTREGKPVASRERWERLARQLVRLPVSWELADKEHPPPEIERARQLARAALARDEAEPPG